MVPAWVMLKSGGTVKLVVAPTSLAVYESRPLISRTCCRVGTVGLMTIWLRPAFMRCDFLRFVSEAISNRLF